MPVNLPDSIPANELRIHVARRGERDAAQPRYHRRQDLVGGAESRHKVPRKLAG